MSSPLCSVCLTHEWEHNGTPGGSRLPRADRGLIFLSLGHRSLEQKCSEGGMSPCREVLGSRPELALTGYSSTLGSRLGRRQWSSDNKMKGTFWRHLSLRKWWPWMVTESEWGLSRCDVRLVSKHCGDSRGWSSVTDHFFPWGTHPSRRQAALQRGAIRNLQRNHQRSLGVISEPWGCHDSTWVF